MEKRISMLSHKPHARPTVFPMCRPHVMINGVIRRKRHKPGIGRHENSNCTTKTTNKPTMLLLNSQRTVGPLCFRFVGVM